ncbi:MAG TPA: hypothetical protein VG273_16390 [Bryobacteraceae bacterium]|jgi:hypothetical protein|nr:hypothetical protein [Bryobacteraceae bacterium]
MPIRRELRHFYRGPAWRAKRRFVLDRAGDKCERCGKPNRQLIWVLRDGTGRWALYWEGGTRNLTLGRWRDQSGAEISAPATQSDPRGVWPFLITCVLTVAHLNQVAGDDRDDNLAALCQRCHLAHDARAHVASARRTRAARVGQGWLSPEIEQAGEPQGVTNA